MRFLIDENLSPRLVVALKDAYPGSTHVEALQLRGRDDASVWAAAREGDDMVLTKDDDFNARSILYGAPPEVVHLRLGNTDTAAVVALLHARRADLDAFARDEVTSLLVLP